MKLWRKFLFIVWCLDCLICLEACTSLGPLKTLIQLGKNQKLQQKALDQETENFRRVRAYLNSNTIEQNIAQEEALELFGYPVLIIPREEGERWIYKESESSWFGGEKVYLYFNKEGRLTSWEYLEATEEAR